MLNDAQVDRMLDKLVRYEKTLETRLFKHVAEVPMRRFETAERWRSVPPEDRVYVPASPGDAWGGEGRMCWFRGEVRIPESCRGRDVFIRPETGAYETLLWVNGVPSGIFASKHIEGSHGNHYCDLLVRNADPGRTVDVALECYAGHYIIGTQPFETAPASDFRHVFQRVELCVRDDGVAAFLFDLKTLNQLAKALDAGSFRRACVLNCLAEVHRTVFYAPDDADEAAWRGALGKAREIMAPALRAGNSASAPFCGLVGHSHMDTAWLWTVPETVTKCARTYSNAVSLMEQYPEYRFIQSSAYHGEVVRRHYPALFERIRQKAAEGRYEPNGGVWVECDCNITSGESMVRQFLWGQRFTREHFGYTSDCFWLPDTFGYSASIPQIMKGCGVDYFLTTKIGWNDTNRFPYETFLWQGIDGTAVFTHFNLTHCWPDPATLIGATAALQTKRVAPRRLISYGYGDGGGGPQFEMIEMARRVRDLEGCPRAEHVRVGAFMRELERESVDAPVFRGELYLELHRGTLTNQHEIKRNNRKAEQALHDLEALTVMRAVREGAEATDRDIRPLMETLLVNQFHDILPGTCIAAAHDQCRREVSHVMARAQELIAAAVPTKWDDAAAVTVLNTCGFARAETMLLDVPEGLVPADGGLKCQAVEGMDGRTRLAVSGVTLPPLGGAVVELAQGTLPVQPCPFTYGNDVLTTPFARVTFAPDGTIASFLDTAAGRELRAGLPLNTFLIAEDVPASWDNWDVDADMQMKFAPCGELVGRRVVSCGSVQFRIRSQYRLSPKSSVEQDIVFHADTPRVDFETVIHWHDRHRFLKAAFDTAVFAGTARHEIQFGHSQRPTTRNNSLEQAMFEVLNHKYTDISETRYGVALLNDCKYGVTVEGGSIRLSLHKGGCRPDPRGDEGTHACTYSLLPHACGFSAEAVVRPAYALNYAPVVIGGRADIPSFAGVDAPNVLIETVKPCEDSERAFILRLYECEGTRARAALRLGFAPGGVELTNMLEEKLETLPYDGGAALEFRPFEIKTVKVFY